MPHVFYTDRATRDFDFIDLGYPPILGKVLVQLRDFDMLEYSSTIISPNYRERAVKLEESKYLNIYLLSSEDIIVSKIIRMEPKDIEDIDILIKKADKELINMIIDEVLARTDLFETKKRQFLMFLSKFRRKYNV